MRIPRHEGVIPAARGPVMAAVATRGWSDCPRGWNPCFALALLEWPAVPRWVAPVSSLAVPLLSPDAVPGVSSAHTPACHNSSSSPASPCQEVTPASPGGIRLWFSGAAGPTAAFCAGPAPRGLLVCLPGRLIQAGTCCAKRAGQMVTATSSPSKRRAASWLLKTEPHDVHS